MMIGDIEAVIRRFFPTVRKDIRIYQDIRLKTGDDTCGFGTTKFGYQFTVSGSTHDIGFVIHGTGGNDRIEFTDPTAGTILDLRAGQLSGVNGHVNNVAIFVGHNDDATEYHIETGIGSRFDDTIIGNDRDNTLDGGTGADHMTGLEADDTYHVDSRRDVVCETGDGGTDTLIVVSGRYSQRDDENLGSIIFESSHVYDYQPLGPKPGQDDPEGGPFNLILPGNARGNGSGTAIRIVSLSTGLELMADDFRII